MIHYYARSYLSIDVPLNIKNTSANVRAIKDRATKSK